jgi:hypothetical protein
MKRYEVTCQPMDSDFPRQQQYTSVRWMRSKRVHTCLRLYGGIAKRTRTTSALLCLYDSTCADGLRNYLLIWKQTQVARA